MIDAQYLHHLLHAALGRDGDVAVGAQRADEVEWHHFEKF